MMNDSDEVKAAIACRKSMDAISEAISHFRLDYHCDPTAILLDDLNWKYLVQWKITEPAEQRKWIESKLPFPIAVLGVPVFRNPRDATIAVHDAIPLFNSIVELN